MSNQDLLTHTALVVDDDPSILQLMEEVLRDAGFDLICMTHVRPALEALATRPFDVLVLDQWLPDGNGLEICEAARTKYGSEPVVLIVTADARSVRHVLALQLCADDFIGKPFDVEELVARIEARLRRAGHARV